MPWPTALRRPQAVAAACCLVATLAACDNGSNAPAETDAQGSESTGTMPDGSTTDTPAAAGPVIIALELRDEELDTDTPATELVAQVGHSEDLGKLVGGLVRKQGVLVGAMLQVSEGTYSFGMTLELLDPSETPTRTVVELEVEFTDRQGRAVSQSVSVSICHERTSHCGETCHDLRSDENCGACGNACMSDEYCFDGDCRYDYDDDYAAGDDEPPLQDNHADGSAQDGEPSLLLPIPSVEARNRHRLDVSAFHLGRPSATR